MSLRFRFEGLEELKQQLLKLPADLAGDAVDIVQGIADEAADAVRDGYPVRETGLHPGRFRKSRWFPPGQLKGRVSVRRSNGPTWTGAEVISGSPIAWLYDNGSEARHWRNGKYVGRMPPTHHFVKTMIRYRAIMGEALKRLLEYAGLRVTGSYTDAA